jgi:excisionase family DNA binding protein
MERYLSAPEAAPIIGVTVQTVYGLVKRGELPLAATTEGGMYLFSRRDVERLATERAERPKRRGALAALPTPAEGVTT